MHYVYWLHRHKRRRWRRSVFRGRPVLTSKTNDYIGVLVSLTPDTLRELKKKAGVQDNEQAVLKAIRHYLRCPYDVNEEDV